MSLLRTYSHRFPTFEPSKPSLPPPVPALPPARSSSSRNQGLLPPAPISPGSNPAIRCSNCSSWIEVDYLEDHVCVTRSREREDTNRARREGNGDEHSRRRRPDMRIEVSQAAYRPSNSKLSPSHYATTSNIDSELVALFIFLAHTLTEKSLGWPLHRGVPVALFPLPNLRTA